MNTVGPYHNRQETYSYFTLPFCRGPKKAVSHYHENMGEALQARAPPPYRRLTHHRARSLSSPASTSTSRVRLADPPALSDARQRTLRRRSTARCTWTRPSSRPSSTPSSTTIGTRCTSMTCRPGRSSATLVRGRSEATCVTGAGEGHTDEKPPKNSDEACQYCRCPQLSHCSCTSSRTAASRLATTATRLSTSGAFARAIDAAAEKSIPAWWRPSAPS